MDRGEIAETLFHEVVMRAENTPVPLQTRGGTCRGAETFAATFASVTRSIPWAHLDRVCSGPPVSCSRAPRHTSLPTFCVPCTTSRWLPSRRRACRRSRRGSMPIARSASTARGGRLASCDRSRCPRALELARGRRCLGARVAAGREACRLRRTRTLGGLAPPGPLGAEPASPLDRPELHRGRNRRRAHPDDSRPRAPRPRPLPRRLRREIRPWTAR